MYLCKGCLEMETKDKSNLKKEKIRERDKVARVGKVTPCM